MLYDTNLRHIREGKIVYLEKINEGLESGPAAFIKLLCRCSVGKQVVVVTFLSRSLCL